MIDYRSQLKLQPLTEMEVIAWAALSDEEFIERIAREVWKIPNAPGYSRVGVSEERVRSLLLFYDVGSNRKRSRKKVRRIVALAHGYFVEACNTWADEIMRMCDRRLRQWPPSRMKLRGMIAGNIPHGARKEVEAIIAKRLNWK